MSGKGRKIVIAVVVLLLVAGGYLFSAQSRMGHIQLPAEEVTAVAGFPIVNTMLATWLTMVLLIVLAWLGTRNLQLVPGRFQGLLELVMGMWLSLVDSVAGPNKGRKFFTLVTTIFLFILVNNWLGLFPFFGTLGLWESHAKEGGATLVPLLRSGSTDLNTTLALAVIAVAMCQFYGTRHLGFKGYASKFINLKGGPIGMFVGALEVVSEVAKIISLSFRLFGNIFAGEVLLATMAFLVPWVAAVPFMGLEMFVGFMQAFVFAMLTLVFATLAITGHDGGHEEHAGAHT